MTAQITPFSTTPSRFNPTTFSADMDTRIVEENRFATEANALSTEVNTLAAQVAAVASDNSQANWGYPASLTPVANQIGVFDANKRLVVPTGGGIKMSNVTNADATTSDWCEKNSYWLATGTGCSGTPPSANVTFTRKDNIISMTVPAIIGTSNTNAFTLSAGPTSMRPSAQRVCNCFIQDSGTNYAGRVVINTDGTMSFFRDYGTPFATSGSKGVQTSSITYLI